MRDIFVLYASNFAVNFPCFVGCRSESLLVCKWT